MATTTGIKRQQTMADPQRLRRTLFIARRTYYTHYAHFPFERYDDKKPDVNSWAKNSRVWNTIPIRVKYAQLYI